MVSIPGLGADNRLFGIRTGSWGTPELGLSEIASNYFGQGRTDNLGSNLFGDQTQTTQVPAAGGSANWGGGNFVQSGSTGAYGISQGNKANPAIPLSPKPTGTSGTGGGGAVLGTNDVVKPDPQGPSAFDQLYSSLGSAYDKMSGDLNPMYARREQGINDIYNLANQGIDLQQQAGLDTLNNQRQGVETNQVRSLKDLSNAITQSYGQFSNQLGNMGAGDSSAARVMLPYALSRTEAQQRGQLNRTTADKMGEINARESALKNSVMQEKNKLDQTKMSEMASLGEWFDNAKMQISQMRLSDAKAAGETVMKQALAEVQRIRDNYDKKSAALESWAVSNSTNLAQLKQNMGVLTDPSLLGPQATYDLSSLGQGRGITTSASQAPVGYGGYGNIDETFKKLGVV